jgi:putative FmdB family regulatory protein
MPLYEYECRGCGCRFETLVRGSVVAACPACQGTDLERILSLFSVDSEGTRKAALAQGRHRVAREQRDKAIAEREAFDHDHH